MRDLATLQDDMAAALLGGDRTHVTDELIHAGRLAIYRNNSFISLTEALKATFPVTVKLADERFFAYAAHCFIAAHPPREARLSAYGGAFPRFLARFEPCRGFPVIAEMAQLEWAIASALTDKEEPKATPALVRTLAFASPAEILLLQPSLRFVLSRFPLLGIWSSHQGPSPRLAGPLEKRRSRIALHRRGDDIHFLELDPARFAFWRALASGSTIEQATHRALSREPVFDLTAEIVTLFRSGLATAAASNRPCH